MRNLRFLRAGIGACLVFLVLAISNVQAEWLVFAGGPAVSTGVWPAGAAYTGGAIATASNFVNGNNATPFIGLTPLSVPNLSPDYFATGLAPNPGPVVTAIATPYNDAADRYHVVIDFSSTTSSAGAGFLPAGSTFAIIDLDIDEAYLSVKATDPSNAAITTGWIAPPSTWFDMNLPMLSQMSLGAPPVLSVVGPGAYNMNGISWNFDVGFWQFQTTQNVRTISFDMAKLSGGNTIGGGGAAWAFYSPKVPEPSTCSLVFVGLVSLGNFARRRSM